MFVSFAERARCVCLGWDLYDCEGYTKYYRRNLTIPARDDMTSQEPLIDIQDFEKYISKVYSTFINMGSNDLIRQAIRVATYRGGRTLESSFFALYSALEMFMLHFRREHGLDAIFPPDEWKSFKKELKAWLKSHPHLKRDIDKRGFIYEKISELNRISFPSVFKKMCDFYSVDLSDLWPVLKNSTGISLVEIRNKLIHGETFNPLQLRALIAAREHLQWIMERLILAVLGWPISKSKVNKDYLAHYMACYKDWGKDQKILT